MTNTTIQINKGDKFVGMWGYDQTQYSIYEVVSTKGKFVTVKGMNGWSNFGERDLTVGSKVKIYKQARWESLTPEEAQDWHSRGFDRWDYERHMREEAIKKAEVRTIVKAGRVNGDKWSYKWELDDGSTYDSTVDWQERDSVSIVDGFTRRMINTKWGTPSIKIDECITASLDTDFARNHEKYVEQNMYTAQNGR